MFVKIMIWCKIIYILLRNLFKIGFKIANSISWDCKLEVVETMRRVVVPSKVDMAN